MNVPAPSLRTPRRWALSVYATLTLIFIVGIIIQVFLVGAGIFDNASWLRLHDIFGHLLGTLPLIMLIIGLAGRLPRSINWLTFLLLFLVYFQSFFIHLPKIIGIPVLSALHPVNALVIFALPLFLLVRIRLLLQAHRQSEIN